MSVELDTQGFWQWLLGVVGVGAGGYKVITHEARLRQLEEHLKDIVDPQLRTLGEGVSGIEAKLDGVADGEKTIQDILIGRGMDR